MDPFQWKCPYCNHNATISDEDYHRDYTYLDIQNAEGRRTVFTEFIVCPNPDCKKFTLKICMHDRVWGGDSRGWVTIDLIREWRLVPPSNAVVFPDYVPKAITDDYNEACLISNLSPKSSATLARRCIQGLLRDFWKVKPGRLVDEIEQIKDKTDPLTWEAIDSVRKIGNIGAHMEKDINLIVDVEPNEAEILIGLIETLVKDWYIAREERKKQLYKIKRIAQDKEDAKKQKAAEEENPQAET
ncbi:hypothetical protein ES703_43455 [subsurface metagenome]